MIAYDISAAFIRNLPLNESVLTQQDSSSEPGLREGQPRTR